ncbi:hypothetical protein CDCA_CDCA11G3176 [Cyanidium caldarium]|uniref:Uncharacterized protein n=1 Tax=Cyanidium caldarium TaxID=2771 RepID=A0AAV9IYE3_CYACA|nr:hypothetical protein CDCA_CDCA11G3176 [Cyanidium caldarium]
MSSLADLVQSLSRHYTGYPLGSSAQLFRFTSEEHSIREPLAHGVPVFYVLAVRGCRFSEFVERLLRRACVSPALPGMASPLQANTGWVLGDSVRFVWVDCGASLEAEEFCRRLQPSELPHIELALPDPQADVQEAAQATIVRFSPKRWDRSICGIRTFLRACGVLPPPGLPPPFYTRWRRPAAEYARGDAFRDA